MTPVTQPVRSIRPTQPTRTAPSTRTAQPARPVRLVLVSTARIQQPPAPGRQGPGLSPRAGRRSGSSTGPRRRRLPSPGCRSPRSPRACVRASRDLNGAIGPHDVHEAGRLERGLPRTGLPGRNPAPLPAGPRRGGPLAGSSAAWRGCRARKAPSGGRSWTSGSPPPLRVREEATHLGLVAVRQGRIRMQVAPPLRMMGPRPGRRPLPELPVIATTKRSPSTSPREKNGHAARTTAVVKQPGCAACAAGFPAECSGNRAEKRRQSAREPGARFRRRPRTGQPRGNRKSADRSTARTRRAGPLGRRRAGGQAGPPSPRAERR